MDVLTEVFESPWPWAAITAKEMASFQLELFGAIWNDGRHWYEPKRGVRGLLEGLNVFWALAEHEAQTILVLRIDWYLPTNSWVLAWVEDHARHDDIARVSVCMYCGAKNRDEVVSGSSRKS